MQLVDSPNNPNGGFTEPELERLAAYRAAVQVGFYSDWDGTAESTDTTALAWLEASDGSASPAAYPFTADERRGLERCRAAVADGTYRDDLPPIGAGATPEQPAR